MSLKIEIKEPALFEKLFHPIVIVLYLLITYL